MRTVTESNVVYKFEELSDDAKEHAVAQYLQNCYDDTFSECVLEDAVRIAKMFGLEIDTHYSRPDINWDIWNSGAAFTGSYTYVKGCVAAVRREAPQDTELHDIVRRLADAQRVLQYSGHATCSASGTFQRVDVYCTVLKTFKAEDAKTELHDALCDYAQWIAARLVREYEYTTSAEYVAEIFDINEYEFYEDGSLS